MMGGSSETAQPRGRGVEQRGRCGQEFKCNDEVVGNVFEDCICRYYLV